MCGQGKIAVFLCLFLTHTFPLCREIVISFQMLYGTVGDRLYWVYWLMTASSLPYGSCSSAAPRPPRVEHRLRRVMCLRGCRGDSAWSWWWIGLGREEKKSGKRGDGVGVVINYCTVVILLLFVVMSMWHKFSLYSLLAIRFSSGFQSVLFYSTTLHPTLWLSDIYLNFLVMTPLKNLPTGRDDNIRP